MSTPPGFTIDAAHPALPGHFPGRPVVPAAVILAEVLSAAARHHPAAPVTGVVQAKFVAPLEPGRRAEIRFTSSARGLCFDCVADDRRIATGLLQTRT